MGDGGKLRHPNLHKSKNHNQSSPCTEKCLPFLNGCFKLVVNKLPL